MKRHEANTNQNKNSRGHDYDRNEHAHHGHGNSGHHHHGHSCACGDSAASTPAGSMKAGNHPPPADAGRVRYRIEHMDCPIEEQLIRANLEPMAGIVRLDFDLINRELTVYHHLEDLGTIESALEKLDMAPRLLENGVSPAAIHAGLSAGKKWALAVAGMAALTAEILAWISGRESSWPVMVLAAVSLLTAGPPTLKKGWIALRNLTLNIYFLMTLATAGALAIGKWPEAAMVVFLFSVAEAIEVLSLERVRNAIASLTALAPETAEVSSGSGWSEQPAAAVRTGAHIRIRAGARVPLDARVESGSASVDQAPITGESMPVDKQAGDQLFAGSIVTDGVVEATVTALAGDSTLARIAAAIQQAQSQRAPTQRFIDRFARYYTPCVVIFAVAAAILGPLLGAGPWDVWLYQALVMLVIACPCALVISTPVTVVSGLTAAARHGVLIKGGVYLEGGRLLKAVAFDKTGTLTLGRPELTDSVALGDLPVDQALLIAASLDDHSTHPIAKALVAGWRRLQPGAGLLGVEEFALLEGRGVKGIVNGRCWHLGNFRLVEEEGMSSPALAERLTAMERGGKTAIVLCSDSGPEALFGMADTIRPESGQAIQSLQELHLETVMLTGDNAAIARSIAARLGIPDARANLMPESKQDAIIELKRRHGIVAMVGDGINDAPALARADIGIAMGAAGTATALETADVAIMDDDPRKVARFIALSRRCATILKQNISLALGIKAVFLLLALMGKATLWMAVFADMGASLIVVFNGLRLLRYFR